MSKIDPALEAFFNDYAALCAKHLMEFSHEDSHGAFGVVDYEADAEGHCLPNACSAEDWRDTPEFLARQHAKSLAQQAAHERRLREEVCRNQAGLIRANHHRELMALGCRDHVAEFYRYELSWKGSQVRAALVIEWDDEKSEHVSTIALESGASIPFADFMSMALSTTPEETPE